MNEQAKPTPGPWETYRAFGEQGLVGPKNGYPVASVTGYYRRHAGQTEANAELIAEAGTVAHETGLTPRQLVEQRKELMEALERLEAGANTVDRCYTHNPKNFAYALQGLRDDAAAARALLAKAEGRS